MKYPLVSCALLLIALSGGAQETAPLREVRGQTVISNELPRAELTISKEFRYLGGQRVNLYGNADAEQHLFVIASSQGQVKRFVWLQFEHFLPTNTYKYDYPADHTINLGGLDFVYDCKSWADYAVLELEDPNSDGAAISRLLAKHNLFLPTEAARVRMFHLPTPDRRTELMIIYGQAVTADSGIPIGAAGIVLDNDAPQVAQRLLDDLKRDLTIRKRN